MNTAVNKLPLWILIVSAIIGLIEMMVSVMLCIAPGEALEMVDLNAKGVHYIIYMWAARQFALGFIFGFAAYKKSAPMLLLAYIFLLVMFIGDLLVGISQKELPLIISAVAMCLIASVMIYTVNKYKTTQHSSL